MSHRRSNPLALAVLCCVSERPMYPYEITTTLRERGKEGSIRLNFGSLYAVIKNLAKHGLIEESQTERDGNRPERTVYQITPTGKTETLDWLRSLISEPAKEYPQFEAGLSFLPMLDPDDVLELLRHRLGRIDEQIAFADEMCAMASRANLPDLFMIEGQYAVAMMRAERNFVAGVADQLAAGTYPEQDQWRELHQMRSAGKTFAEVAAELPMFGGIDYSKLPR
jgi:DNA-binding PadR family transcriptional regulator